MGPGSYQEEIQTFPRKAEEKRSPEADQKQAKLINYNSFGKESDARPLEAGWQLVGNIMDITYFPISILYPLN